MQEPFPVGKDEERERKKRKEKFHYPHGLMIA
jgi:hypothetical protein